MIGATGTSVHTSRQEMCDNSHCIGGYGCVAVGGPAKDRIYTGRGSTAMRAQYSKNPAMRGRLVLQSVVHSRPLPTPPPYSPRRRRLARLLQQRFRLHAARPRPRVDHRAGLQCHGNSSSPLVRTASDSGLDVR